MTPRGLLSRCWPSECCVTARCLFGRLSFLSASFLHPLLLLLLLFWSLSFTSQAFLTSPPEALGAHWLLGAWRVVPAHLQLPLLPSVPGAEWRGAGLGVRIRTAPLPPGPPGLGFSAPAARSPSLPHPIRRGPRAPGSPGLSSMPSVSTARALLIPFSCLPSSENLVLSLPVLFPLFFLFLPSLFLRRRMRGFQKEQR